MPSPPTNVRKLVLALSCGISFLLYLYRYAWGMIKPSLKAEFGWDDPTLGWLDSFFVATYAAGQVPSGILCDWFGARVLLGSNIILWSLSLIGFVLATGFATMAVARMLFGITQAGCYPILGKVSKNWFPIGARPNAQAWIATFFGRGGGAISFILFGTVLLGQLKLPWRSALALYSFVGVVCGIVFLLLFRNSPREHPWVNEAEAELIVAGDPHAEIAARLRLSWRALLRSTNMRILLAAIPRSLTSSRHAVM